MHQPNNLAYDPNSSCSFPLLVAGHQVSHGVTMLDIFQQNQIYRALLTEGQGPGSN